MTERRGRRWLATALLMPLIAGCAAWRATGQTGPTPTLVPVTILSHDGFLVQPNYPGVLAAPSLLGLRGLVHGIGSDPRLDMCRTLPALKGQCWLDIKDPGNALFVAAYVEAPCAENSLQAALTGSAEITITATAAAAPDPRHPGLATSPGQCAGAMPSAERSLLSIPLSAVPSGQVVVKVVHSGASIAAESTTVDLASPLNVSTDLDAKVVEVQTSINEAFQDALSAPGTANAKVRPGASVSLHSFGTARWDSTDLGCPSPGKQSIPTTETGYTIGLVSSDQPSTVFEYHISGNLMSFCGRIAP